MKGLRKIRKSLRIAGLRLVNRAVDLANRKKSPDYLTTTSDRELLRITTKNNNEIVKSMVLECQFASFSFSFLPRRRVRILAVIVVSWPWCGQQSDLHTGTPNAACMINGTEAHYRPAGSVFDTFLLLHPSRLSIPLMRLVFIGCTVICPIFFFFSFQLLWIRPSCLLWFRINWKSFQTLLGHSGWWIGLLQSCLSIQGNTARKKINGLSSIPRLGYEPAITVIERAKTVYASHCAPSKFSVGNLLFI
jgi:hypothetical protein